MLIDAPPPSRDCPVVARLRAGLHFRRANEHDREPKNPFDCTVGRMPRVVVRRRHLDRIACSLSLFVRVVADGELVGWIDAQLDHANNQVAPDRGAEARSALIEPLHNVYGVSDKCGPWRCPAF